MKRCRSSLLRQENFAIIFIWPQLLCNILCHQLPRIHQEDSLNSDPFDHCIDLPRPFRV